MGTTLIATTLMYVNSLLAIWFGAGLIVQAVDRIARKLRLSSFVISFFLLGLLTSIPETAVSFGAVAEGRPEIFVGTLLGGVVVIFLLVIPVLAILGRGIKIDHQLDRKTLLMALGVMLVPGLLVIDQRVTNAEGAVMILAYLGLFYVIQKGHGIFSLEEKEIINTKRYSFVDLLKVLLGAGMVFISSSFIVDQTIVYSQILRIPAFYISLIVLGIGANLPELSLAIRAVLSGNKDIAFGDYLGSASANTLLFGFFTLLNKGEVLTVNHFLITFGFIVTGLGLFYYFSQSKKDISAKEGWVLLCIYILFAAFELWRGVVGN